jgi:uncharacterized protein (TIGR02246 family)
MQLIRWTAMSKRFVLISTWLEATAAGDLPHVLELMADDVVFLGAGRPPMRGRNGYATASKAIRGRVEGAADIQEIRVWVIFRDANMVAPANVK